MTCRCLSLALMISLPAFAGNGQMARRLGEVTVSADRPLSEIGVVKLSLDSTALRENISLSMADVIGSGSSLFVKSSGRATLSTVTFRGTSPSHTIVTWNGLPLNSPSLGMTDFSLLPACFIDRASLLYGTTSLLESSGGLGGAVSLSSSSADIGDGIGVQYVQGVGSFTTFDEFLRITYGSSKWRVSTRVAYSSSKNDFKFVNHDKKENVYDEDHNIVSQYYPEQRNKNGAYGDFHFLQEVYYSPGKNDETGLSVWYTGSDREIPLSTVDYNLSRMYENRSRENTLRAVLSWRHHRSLWRLCLRGGLAHTWMAYDYSVGQQSGSVSSLTDSRTKNNTYYFNGQSDWMIRDNLFLTANLTVKGSNVRSVDRASLTGDLGYDRSRMEAGMALSARWQICSRVGASLLLREDVSGGDWSPFVPAFFVDALISRRGNVMARASVSRNHRFPTLNDLYFIPGGNPDLKAERGITYDAGITFGVEPSSGRIDIHGGLTWFDSYIDDWIMWLPTTKGFFSPRNMKKVHSYGIEANAAVGLKLTGDMLLDLGGSFSWTPSVNMRRISDADMSVGSQIPYVPLYSASASGRLTWRSWGLAYKWCYYSERYTMTSAENAVSGALPSYFMSGLSVEKQFVFNPLDLSLKLAVNNLLDADYQTVMSYPMPGINFELFVSVTPKF